MVNMIPVKCPACGASLQIEDNRDKFFCSYCGTQILVNDDTVTKHYEINEAEIRKVEAEERIQNRRMEIEENRNKRKWILITVYAGICALMGLITFISYQVESQSASALLMTTILLITLPVMIFLTRMIVGYDETTVETNTETKWFGFIRHTTREETSPGKRVLILWGVYAYIMFMVFLFSMM